MTIRYSLSNFDELSKQFGSHLIRNAQFLAINKVLPKLRTHLSARIRERYNVTARAVAERVTLRKASMTTGQLEGVVRFKGSRIGLINFDAREKKVTVAPKPRKGQKGAPFGRYRKGVTVKVFKSGPRTLSEKRSAFIATGLGGNKHIFYRQQKKKNIFAKSREVLRAAYQYSIAEMVTLANGSIGSSASYQAHIKSEFDKEFDVAVNYYSNMVGPHKAVRKI